MEKESESSTSDFASSSHTCITCRVVFARGELQREHYKSDWHRYNLKRKVAELPPVTAAVFQSKVLAQRQLEEGTTKDVSFQCDCCYKTFQSKETYESHCRSKKHLDALAKSKNEPKAESETPDKPETKETAEAVVEESPMDVKENEEDWETDEEGEDAAGDDGIPSTDCLFCSHSSSSVEENLSHMSVRHGFFIPDAEYCTDVEGLLTYLGAKVGMGFVCMWCNEQSRTFQTLDAVQKHMRDKAHCKIKTNTSGIIIRLQRLPMEASSADVREFFHGLRIPDGGAHIIGGREGDAFIAFCNDEDARQAMRLDGKRLKSAKVKLLLSSRSELQQIIEKAHREMKMHQAAAVIVSQDRPRDARRRSPSRSPERLRNQHHHHQHHNRRSRSRSPIDRGSRGGGHFEGNRHHHPQRNDSAPPHAPSNPISSFRNEPTAPRFQTGPSSTMDPRFLDRPPMNQPMFQSKLRDGPPNGDDDYILEVGDIPYKATQHDLRSMFEAFRPVEIRRLYKRIRCNAKLVPDSAFVIFETRNDADSALSIASRRLLGRDVRINKCGRTSMDAAFERAPPTPPESIAEWIVREPSTNDDQQQHPPVSEATNTISPSSPLNVVPASTSAQSCVNEEGVEFGSTTDSDRTTKKERTNIGVGMATVRPYVAEERTTDGVDLVIGRPCGKDETTIGVSLVTGRPYWKDEMTEKMEKNGSDDGNTRDASIGPCRLVTKAIRAADGDNPSVASIGPSTESKTAPVGGNMDTVPRNEDEPKPRRDPPPSAKKIDLRDEGIEILEVVEPPPPPPTPIFFNPVSNDRRRQICATLGLVGKIKNRLSIPPRCIMSDDRPVPLVTIGKDGNCFFRAIGHYLTGTEEEHPVLRRSACDKIKSEPTRYLGDENVAAYFQRRRTDQDGKWATSVEMQAMADLLDVTIYCFGRTLSLERWIAYFPNDRQPTDDDESIFLVNQSRSHFVPVYRWVDGGKGTKTPLPKINEGKTTTKTTATASRSKPLEKPKPLNLAKQHAGDHHSAQSQLLIQPAVAGVGGYASLGGPSGLGAIPQSTDVGGGHLSQQGVAGMSAHFPQSIIHHHDQQQQQHYQMSNMNHAGGDGTTAVSTDEILETMEQINRSIEAGQFSTTLAGHIFRLYGYLKHVGELLEQSHKGEINRVFDTLRQARSHHLGKIGLSSRLEIRRLEELRAGWRPNLAHSQYRGDGSSIDGNSTINEFNPISANETMSGGDMEKFGAASVSAPPFGSFPMNPFAFNMQPNGAPVASAAELVSSAAAVATTSMTPSQGPSYYLIPASHVGHTQAGIDFISPTAAGNVLPPPPISPMAASHAADHQRQRLHMPVTASLSQPALSTSPPNFPKEAVTKTSGKYSSPAKIPGKSQYRDEVVIRNADSEIKRRRFEKVSQAAKERTLTIPGPTEESIDQGKILIEETIRQNVSPMRGEGVEENMYRGASLSAACFGDDGEEHVRNGEDGSEEGEDGKERRTSEDDNREFTIEPGQLGEMLKLECNDPALGNQGLRRTTTDDAARDQARKERRKSMPTLDNQRLLALKQSSPPKIDGTQEAGEGDPALSTGIGELENAADDEGGKSNKPLTLTMMIAPPIGKQKASSAARSTPNLTATGLNKRALCLMKSVDASGRGSDDGVGDAGQVETKFMADESGGDENSCRGSSSLYARIRVAMRR